MSEIQERLAAQTAATLFEADPGRVSVLDATVRPVYRPILLAGPAFTVRAVPGDNLAIHRALAEAPAGSILAVVTGRDRGHGFFGEVMMEGALARGLAGLVIDGGVRDTAAITARRFPVFAGGVAIRGTAKSDAGALRDEITLAGAILRPGDWIVGDDDGVVVVPAGAMEDIVALADARVSREATMIERIRAGETTLAVLGLAGPSVRPRDSVQQDADPGTRRSEPHD